MRRKLAAPLPQRFGLDPVRLFLPADGPGATVREHLVGRLPRVAPERIDAMLRAGGIVGPDGPIAVDTAYTPNSFVWFHRDLPEETPVPGEIPVLFRDEELLVVDKPHFLATIPRGRHIRQTALVRLRTELDLPRLSPAHRLDRVTAGVLVFVLRPEHRGAYQTLFARRAVHKEYEAVAPHDPELSWPRLIRSRIVKDRGVLAARTEAGEPNAETRIELLATRDGLGRYRLLPRTGRTHQLRVHMNELGLPILGDPFYPVLTDTPLDDFRRPLQLLARTLAFTDPFTGQARRFTSRAELRAWHDPHGWAENPPPATDSPPT